MRGLRKQKSDIIGGLALHSDSLRYIELQKTGQDFHVFRQEFLPLMPNCIIKGSVRQFDLLQTALKELQNSLGSITCPVVMGIPANDVTLRTVKYPVMSMEDTRGALSLEFDKYFSYSWSDASADFTEIEVPAAVHTNRTFLVAASRKDYANNLLHAASCANIAIAALEPMTVVFFRAICGQDFQNLNHLNHDKAYLLVELDADITNFILGWHDNGILYRTIVTAFADINSTPDALSTVIQEIQNTIDFCNHEYYGLKISQVILGGSRGQDEQLKIMLENNLQLKVTCANVWTLWRIHNELDNIQGFETAIGLAMRQFKPLNIR